MQAEYKNFLKKKAQLGSKKPEPKQSSTFSSKFAQKKKKTKGRSFPVLAVLFSAAGLFAGLWVVNDLEGVEKMFEAVEIGVYPQSVAQENQKKETAKKEEKSESTAAAGVTQAETAKTSWTPEEIALFKRLDERKTQLDLKEAELVKLEAELKSQKEMLDQRLKELELIRSDVANQLQERVEIDQNRVTKLVDVYSNMKPSNAAKVFETLDEDLAVEVLGNMKKKSAADILNLLPAEKAQRLSEKYAGYKRR